MTDVTSSEAPTELPGRAVPYVMAAGGGRAHLLIDQVGRCLAGAEETGGALSMMTLDGPAGPPIPLHYHNKEYEFFFCHRGTIQLWLDGESRILHPGDFGYAPPGTVHAYRLLSDHAGFVGPIVPGGWDRFFDLTGIPYAGRAPFPVGFRPEVPFAKFGQAEHDFDMKYLPDEPYAEARLDATDDTLPGSAGPYFLRAGAGPRYRIAGGLATALCTSQETDGKLAMVTVELPRGAGVPDHVHDQTTEGIYVLEGSLRVWIDGEEHRAGGGDYVSIPAGTSHRWEGAAFFTRAISMTTPGGLEALLDRAGEATELPMFGDDEPVALSAQALTGAAEGLDLRLT
jgi:quercetin 2,3-dioxygenase